MQKKTIYKRLRILKNRFVKAKIFTTKMQGWEKKEFGSCSGALYAQFVVFKKVIRVTKMKQILYN